MSNGSGFISAFNSVLSNTGNIDILTKTTTVTLSSSFGTYVKGSYMCVGDLLINFNGISTANTTSTRLTFAQSYADTPYSVIATNYAGTLPQYSFDVSGISFTSSTTLANVQFIAIGPRPTSLY